MQTFKLFFKIFVLTLLISFSAYSQDLNIQKISPYPIDEVIEVHKGPMNSIQIWTKVLFPNGCYKEVRTVGLVDQEQKQIWLKNESIKHDGFCTQAFAAQFPKTEIAGLEKGQYELLDSFDGSQLGKILVFENEVQLKE